MSANDDLQADATEDALAAEIEEHPDAPTEDTQVPTVGRIVQYRDPSQPMKMAALITGVDPNSDREQWVTLTVFPPHRTAFHRTASRGDLQGQWNWPPR